MLFSYVWTNLIQVVIHRILNINFGFQLNLYSLLGSKYEQSTKNHCDRKLTGFQYLHFLVMNNFVISKTFAKQMTYDNVRCIQDDNDI